MSLTRNLAHNTLVQIIGKTISTMLGVAALAIITRYLGSEGFGYYSTVNAFLQFFGVLVDGGLVITSLAMISAPGANLQKIFSNLFTLRLFSATTLFGLAIAISWFFPYPIIVKLGIALLSVSFLAVTFNQVLIGLFQKRLEMSKVVGAEIGGRLVLVGALAGASWLDLGFFAVLGAIILGTLTNFLALWRARASFVKVSLAFDFSLWRQIVGRSWPIGASIFFNLFYLHAGVVILSLIKPATEVGLYGAAFRTLETLLTIPMLFMGLVLPLLVDAWERQDKPAFKEHLNRAFKFLTMLGLPFIVGAFFTATRVMKLIAGPDFSASGPILQVLSLALALICVSSILTHTVVAIGKQKTMLWGFALAAAVAGLGFFTLGPKLGGLGIAISTTGAELVTLIFSSILVARTTRIFFSPWILWKIVFSSALMAGVLWALDGAPVLVMVAVGIAVYGAGLFLTRALTWGMVKEITGQP